MKKNCFALFLVLLFIKSNAQPPTCVNYTAAAMISGVGVENGHVWCAADGGLIDFDPQSGNKVVYTAANSGLTTNNLTGLFVGHNGTKWIGTLQNGLFILSGNQWAHYSTIQSQLIGSIFKIIEVNNNIYIFFADDATHHNFTMKFTGGAGTPGLIDLASPFACAYWNGVDFTVDLNENIYVSNLCGLSKFDGTTWTHIDTTNANIIGNKFRTIDCDKNGSIWASIADYSNANEHLYKWDGITWDSVYNALTSPTHKVYIDWQNKKYFYHINDILVYNDTTWTNLVMADAQMIYHYATSLCVDSSNGKIWSGYTFGSANNKTLFGADGLTDNSYNISAYDFRDNYFSDVEIDNNGYVWAVNNSALFKKNTGPGWQKIPSPPTFNYGAEGIKADQQNNIWVCQAPNQGGVPTLAKFDGTSWTTYNTFGDIWNISMDAAGTLWMGDSQNGIISYDGITFQSFNPNDPLSIFQPTDVWGTTVDTHNNIWFGDYYSIGRKDSSGFSFWNASNSPLASYNNFFVFADKQGYVWIPGDVAGTVYRFDGTTWMTFNSGNSSWPAQATLQGLVDDGIGNIYLKTDKGIVLFDSISFTFYSHAVYGMGITGWHNGIELDSHGNLWTAHYGEGVSVFNPFGITDDAPVPAHHLIGNVFRDINGDGINNGTDYGIPMQKALLLPDSVYQLTNANGDYSFYADTGSYEDIFIVPNNWLLTTDSLSYHSQLVSNDITGLDFGVDIETSTHRVDINLTGGIPRCDNVVPFWLTVSNPGTEIENVIAYFVYDSLLTFVSSYPAASSVSGDTLFFNINQLLPFGTQQITIQMQIPNQNFSGNPVTCCYAVNFALNTSPYVSGCMTDTISCSYDPNDKKVLPQGIGLNHYTLISDTLLYTIRFQNTGNDTAFTVVIYDTISPFLDMQTFEFVASSHPVVISYNQQGAITFRFDNILLPDSGHNYTASNGFVSFRIKPKSSTSDFSVAINKAYIVFDFNVPVMTNQTFNTLVTTIPVSLSDINSGNNIFVYPNPSSGIINFKNFEQGKKYKIHIFDLAGKVVLEKWMEGNSVKLDGFSKGMYFFKMSTSDELIQFYGKIILETK